MKARIMVKIAAREYTSVFQSTSRMTALTGSMRTL